MGLWRALASLPVGGEAGEAQHLLKMQNQRGGGGASSQDLLNLPTRVGKTQGRQVLRRNLGQALVDLQALVPPAGPQLRLPESHFPGEQARLMAKMGDT